MKALLDAGADPSRCTREGLSPYRLALQFGLTEAAARLRAQTDAPEISDDERFVAACARGDEAGATAPGNLDHNPYYKCANALWFGIYYHGNHHRKPILFNPKYMPMTHREMEAGEPEPA